MARAASAGRSCSSSTAFSTSAAPSTYSPAWFISTSPSLSRSSPRAATGSRSSAMMRRSSATVWSERRPTSAVCASRMVEPGAHVAGHGLVGQHLFEGGDRGLVVAVGDVALGGLLSVAHPGLVLARAAVVVGQPGQLRGRVAAGQRGRGPAVQLAPRRAGQHLVHGAGGQRDAVAVAAVLGLGEHRPGQHLHEGVTALTGVHPGHLGEQLLADGLVEHGGCLGDAPAGRRQRGDAGVGQLAQPGRWREPAAAEAVGVLAGHAQLFEHVLDDARHAAGGRGEPGGEVGRRVLPPDLAYQLAHLLGLQRVHAHAWPSASAARTRRRRRAAAPTRPAPRAGRTAPGRLRAAARTAAATAGHASRGRSTADPRRPA